MLEVEVKYRVVNPAEMLEKIRSVRVGAREEFPEEDHYFNAPDRDFKRTDETLRFRQSRRLNRLTYKGPKRASEAKTREEIEVELADGDIPAVSALRLLLGLGYRPVAVVRKWRTVYRVPRGKFNVAICMDEVDRVGSFVELEIVADEALAEEASAAVLGLAGELGLGERETRSYLHMYLESLGAKSRDPTSTT